MTRTNDTNATPASPATPATERDADGTARPGGHDVPPARCSVFTAPQGGVMTREVGVITGELELCTAADAGGALRLRVRYAGAAEWYTVDGGPHRLHDPRDHEVLHEVLIHLLHRPQP